MLGILLAQDFLSIYRAFLLVFFSMNLTTCREFFSLIEWQMKCLTVFVQSYRWVEDCFGSFLSLCDFQCPFIVYFYYFFLLQWLSLDHATQCPFYYVILFFICVPYYDIPSMNGHCRILNFLCFCPGMFSFLYRPKGGSIKVFRFPVCFIDWL